MTAAMRVMIAATIAGLALPAGATQPGGTSRGTITISVSVAAQARLTGDRDGVCLWSNTATRLLAVTTADASRSPTPGDEIVAAATPGCATGGRLTLAALHGSARTILVSPE